MKCPAFLTPHLPYLRWGLPWVFVIPTVKIAGFLLWPWWLVCFSTFIGPAVYFGLVLFAEIKESKELDEEIKDLRELHDINKSILQEIMLMNLKFNSPNNTDW